MLLALLTFSISVIWFLIEFSEVECICNYDVTGADCSRSLAPPLCLLSSFIFFFNLFFQIQPSSELDSVDMNFMGEADAVPVPTLSLLTQTRSRVEEKLNLIHKLNSLSACCGFCSCSVKLIELDHKVIGISAVSFHIILHVILIMVQRELDAVC